MRLGGSLLAYSIRRSEGVEKAEGILLRAQATHPKVAMIAFNLACYASVTGRMEDAKNVSVVPSTLTRRCVNWRPRMKISSPYGIGSLVWISPSKAIVCRGAAAIAVLC
jgi:hypothetical protein